MIADRRFSTNPARVKNRHLLIPALQQMFRRKKAKEWHRILVQAQVPATPVFNIRDVVRDPQVRNRRMIIRSDGDISRLGSPMRFYETKPKKTIPAPQLGQHSTEILTELDYSSQEIKRLKASGALV
ncbi:CoA transferase [Candidatus Bathyarchaeota archaeon]|nr:MAG: CoA transferase [Candidatus Bathyarchaeota archaeon]